MTGTAICFMIILCGGIWGSLAWALVRTIQLEKKNKD